MGEEALHLLVVEDSADDATLLMAELRRKREGWVHERVQTRHEFLSALKQRRWDAIISDYVLPEFSGPEALRLLREHDPDLPFIMVSGIYGEEEAVRMMKAGANDYVMKANLYRLAPALEREIKASHDRRQRKRAEGAMQFLASIVESSADAIYGKNMDSIIVSWNPAAEQMFGYSAEEIIGHSNALLFPRHRRDEMLDILAGIRRGDVVGVQETERVHKDGRIIPISVTVSPIRDGNGEIMGASSIARDISQQKQAETERQQLIDSLTAASNQLHALRGLLPICASCKSIRDDNGYWQKVETYISQHAEVTFSHGLCPACAKDYERQFELDKK